MSNIRESYKYYKRVTDNPRDIKDYINLCNMFNQFLMDKTLAGEEITLPARLGTLSILGKKQKVRFDENNQVVGLPPNWRKTKELWERNPEAKAEKRLVYCTNEHTGNTRYRFVWSKKNVLVTNKTLYSLRITRTNKRVLHKKILNGQEYVNG